MIQLHDMDMHECVWKHHIKLIEPANNANNNEEYPQHMARSEWDALCMSYDLAVIGTSFDTLDKHAVTPVTMSFRCKLSPRLTNALLFMNDQSIKRTCWSSI